jgi:hypothetical protein
VSAAPDYVAPVSGWRTWRIDQSGPEARLASVVRPAAWPVGEALVAACPGITFAHQAPGPGCRCGIHAARDAAEAAFHAELPSRARELLAVGLASLWGRVVEGEAGWRASHAYPATLYVIQRRQEDQERCGEIAWDLTAYGVPAGVLDCSRRGALEALRAMAPAARRPRPLPVAAPAEA